MFTETEIVGFDAEYWADFEALEKLDKVLNTLVERGVVIDDNTVNQEFREYDRRFAVKAL